MWALFILASCAVIQAGAIILHQDIGPVHIHAKAGKPMEEYLQLDSNDVSASESMITFFKDLKAKLGTNILKGGNYTHHFNMNEISTDVNLQLYDIFLKGFRNAVLHSLVIRLKDGRVNINASVPFLSTACTFFTNGVIDGNHTYVLFGNLSAVLEEITITGILNFKEKELPSVLRSTYSTAYQIEDADVTIDIKNIMVQIKIIEELQAFKMTLALIMNKPVDDIIKSVTGAVLLVLNEQLAKIQPADLKYLLQRKPIQGDPLIYAYRY